MRRREFITLIGGAAATLSPTARAQDSDRRPTIGFQSLTADRTDSSFQSASTTEAPDSAKAFAVARPNPPTPPVTNAIRMSTRPPRGFPVRNDLFADKHR